MIFLSPANLATSVIFISASTLTQHWTADYVAPVNPCRFEDTFCSTKCKVLQLRGEIQCDFCVCANSDDYGMSTHFLRERCLELLRQVWVHLYFVCGFDCDLTMYFVCLNVRVCAYVCVDLYFFKICQHFVCDALFVPIRYRWWAKEKQISYTFITVLVSPLFSF